MNPTIKKWVMRPFLVFLIFIAIVFGIGFVVLTTQQQRLVDLAVSELNDQINGELVVRESGISIFKNFPYVSIALHHVEFYDDKSKTDSPVYIEHVYAGFALSDLLKKNYNVRQLKLTNGFVKLIQAGNGSLNLLEAMGQPKDTVAAHSDTTTAITSVTLEKIVLKNINVSFLDEKSTRRLHSSIDNLSSSFSIDSTRLSAAAEGSMKLDFTSSTDTTFFRNKAFTVDLVASYDWLTNKLDLPSCHLLLEEASFIATGSADFKDTTDLDLSIKGDKQDFKLISAFIPEKVKKNLSPFAYDGRLYFDARILGKLTHDHMPLIKVNFGCEDAWIRNVVAKRKVDEVRFRGYYTNGEGRSPATSEIHIVNVHARPEKGIFNGNFILKNFNEPLTLVQINSDLELRFLGEFLGIHDLKQTTGSIRLDMNFKELTDITLPEESLNKLKEGIQSKLIVQNLSFHIPGYPHAVHNLNLIAEMEDGKITIDSASLHIGDSDLHIEGTITDIRDVLHHHEKPVRLTLNARSDTLFLSKLLSFDTALARKVEGEHVTGFNVALMLETSVLQLLNPAPLPKGTLEMKNLNATFKVYPHTFKNLSATVMINDTTLHLRNLTGAIDSSDFQFSGRVNNYALWFKTIMKGETQIAFDFKSNRFALQDVFGRTLRQYLPRGYRREMLKNAWLRTKIDLRYDTSFRFAKAKIANVSGELVKHKLKLNNISGHVKYGRRVLVLDTMRGSIGKTDFDLTLKYYNGPDRNMQKRTNFLKFTSTFFDADEMSEYDLAPKTGTRKTDSLAVTVADSTRYKDAFNIFVIPFSDFNAEIDIAKIKYNRLWLKDVTARLRMQEDHNIFIDTIRMKFADGTLALSGHLNGNDPNRIYFRSKIDVDQVDLEKTMVKLDHFGQDVMINKNIKGKISGQIRSYVQIHPNFIPILNKTKADLKVTVYNGSLVDFAPMKEMASYFKDKNLNLIRFDTLRNRLSFTNGMLNIPSMDINSSLGYIQMSGKQTVDLKMEYYVRVPLKMVTRAGLGSLFKQKPDEVDLARVDEIEYINKDRNMSFMNLKVVGKPGDIEVALGKDRSKRGRP